VRWIEEVPPPPTTFNDISRASVQAEVVQAAPYNLNGAGVALGEWDEAHVDPDHDDFAGRLILGDTAGTSQHATHVGGTMAGDGTLSAVNGGTTRQWRGMAPGATLVSYDWSSPTTEHNAAINTYGIVNSQNSWGFVINSANCSLFGDYTLYAPEYDQIITGLYGAGINIVFAAGNERDDGDCHLINGAPSYVNYACVGPPGTGKNIITVGALNADNTTISTFSSWGPTDDGRLKPEISAPGCPVTSTLPGDTYAGGWCGTSMAAPAVSGCIGLLVQDYRATHAGQNPLPSTVRGLLLHAATDLDDGTTWFNKGPDYASGFGRLQIKNAVDQLRAGGFLTNAVSHSQTNSYVMEVPAGAAQVKVTLTWDDPAAVENAALTLVNDLDLVVLDPNGVRRYPWTLDPGNPSADAIRAVEDHTNVVEQVVAEASGGTDNASGTAYDDGWQNGDSSGSGFGPWQLNPATSGSTAGFFIGSSTNNGTPGGPGIDSTGGKAWGVYANSSAMAEAVRNFAGGGLLTGDTFSLDLDNGWLDGLNTSAGFGLQNSAGQNRFELYFRAGDANYTVNDASGPHSSGIAWTDKGVHAAFTLTGPDTYSVTITRLADNAQATLTGTLAGTAGSSVDRVRLFYYNADGGGGARDVFFNNLSVTGSALPAGNWTVRVAGRNVPVAAPQKYTLVFTPLGIDVPPNLVLDNAAFADSAGGNGNGVVEPGETIRETIVLSNAGGGIASNVTASLATGNAGVSMTQPVAAYPNVPMSGASTNTTPFEYRLAKTVPCGTTLVFTNVATAAGGYSVTNTFTRFVGQPTFVTNVFESADVPLMLPDVTTVYSTNAVSNAGAILDVDVALYLTHTWDGDLEIAVQHPDGTEAILADNRGGSGDGYGSNCVASARTTFDDEAGTPISAGAAPFVGSYRPDSALSNFDGKATDGTWKLRVSDIYAGDSGTLYCWSLRIVSQQGAICNIFNNPPIASNQNPTVTGDLANGLSLAGSDVDADPVSFRTNSLPAHGLLSNFDTLTGAITYTPFQGYVGADSFTFVANDGTADSLPATVSLTVVAPPDSDGDGMPDWWESLYGVSDPNADGDGDGLTNLQEYLAVTGPANADSALRITSIARSGNDVIITFTTALGKQYAVEYRDTMSGTWTQLGGAVAGTGSSAQATDANAAALSTRHYRARIVP
jgi:subtilisin-like proprotein convertase family protein